MNYKLMTALMASILTTAISGMELSKTIEKKQKRVNPQRAASILASWEPNKTERLAKYKKINKNRAIEGRLEAANSLSDLSISPSSSFSNLVSQSMPDLHMLSKAVEQIHATKADSPEVLQQPAVELQITLDDQSLAIDAELADVQSDDESSLSSISRHYDSATTDSSSDEEISAHVIKNSIYKKWFNRANRLNFALTDAAHTGNIPAMEKLLAKGANLNHCDRSGITIAREAVHQPHVLQFLIKCGAPLDARDRSGHTPLAMACLYNCTEAVQLLLANGANPNNKDHTHITPLIEATHANADSQLVQYLLAGGGGVNAQDVWGRTALMGAARNNNCIVAMLLLQAGADKNLFNKKGKTALNIAEQYGSFEMIELLKS